MIASRILAQAASLGLLLLFAAGCGGRGGDSRTDAGDEMGTHSEMGVDGSSGCTAMCSGVCVDTNADNRNCGRCGNACPSGVTCAGGSCSCAAPRMGCGGACVDPMTDATNCGTCGHTCASDEQCTGGTCIAGCTAPRVVCSSMSSGTMDAGTPDAGVSDASSGDGAASDAGGHDAGPPDLGAGDAGVTGVCSDLTSDPLHCGVCSNHCAAGSVCMAGHCQCPTGQEPCGGVCTDVQSNTDHCGGCRVSCGPGGTCSGGMCSSCGTGFETCPGTLGCIDPQTNKFNCGTCGHACGDTEYCLAGHCGCTAPSMECGTECKDLSMDNANCGACGNDCGPGDCVSGACICHTGAMNCGTTCANTTTDKNHCGDCTTVCPGMQVCVASACIDAPLYHGWSAPVGLVGCDTSSYDTTLPTVLGGTYPSNASDSTACRAWKLAATVCNDMPVMYIDTTNWQCNSSGGFTDPVFGTYCTSPAMPQYACSTCPGACNAGTCSFRPLSLRNCSGMESSEM